MNIRTFWDGNDYVIVIKNCNREDTKNAICTVVSALAAEECPESCAVPIVEPQETMPSIPVSDEPVPEFRLNTKKYHGMTPMEALEQDKKKAYGNLAFRLSKTKDPVEKEAIKKALDEYFKATFAPAKQDPYAFVQQKFTMENCQEFFLYFGSILTDAEKSSVADMAGMADFDTFLKTGTLTQLQSLLATVLEKNL